MEPDEVQFGIPLELVIHGGQMQVTKMPIPDGTVTILQFVTPAMAISVRLDDNGLGSLIQALTGGIVVPPQGSGLVLP